VAALASAERSLQFEHRDLHWGNILINRTNDKKKKLYILVEEQEYEIESCGLEVTIIDFTLARLSSGKIFVVVVFFCFVFLLLHKHVVISILCNEYLIKVL